MRRLLTGSTGVFTFVLLLCAGCIASRLSNGFDLKGPKGFIGYLTVSLTQSSSCYFDTDSFDTCAFGQ